MHELKVSVIIPVYNVENYLAECLDSVIRQGIDDEIEIICINDGSTDRSLDILKKYQAECSGIKIISQDNQGLSCARNEGLKLAKGEYVYFLDSDDMMADNVLEEMYDNAVAKQLDVMYFDAETLYDSKEMEELFPQYRTSYRRRKSYGLYEKGQELLRDLVVSGEYKVSSCLQFMRRGFLMDSGLNYYPGILYEDNLFSFQCLLKAGRVFHVAKPYFVRRVRKKSIMTKSKGFENFYGLCITYKEMLAFIEREEINVDKEFESAVLEIISNIRCLALDIYTYSLSGKEKEKANTLSIVERGWVEVVLGQKSQSIYPFPYYLLEQGSRVVLYGAGNIGRRYYSQLSDNKYVEVVKWVDKDFERMRSAGYLVDEISTIRDIDYDVVFLAVADKSVAKEIMHNLELLGIDRNRIIWQGNEYCKNKNDQMMCLNTRLAVCGDSWRQTIRKGYLFMLPEHGNLGDYAIGYAERSFLRVAFPDIKLVEVTTQSWQRCKNFYGDIITNEDIIFISGGGYIGNLWQSGTIVKGVIASFPDNVKIMFPNTLTCANYDDATVCAEAEFYKNQRNLFMFAREQSTYRRFLQYGFRIKDELQLFPDMALSLNPDVVPLEGRAGALLCFRNDVEKVGSDDDITYIKDILNGLKVTISETDIHLHRTIKWLAGERELDKKLREFGNVRLVITDRLHAMILAAVTGTPCIAFDNATHKVSGVYQQWLASLPYIKLADGNVGLKILINELLSLSKTKYESKEIKEELERMSEYIGRLIYTE